MGGFAGLGTAAGGGFQPSPSQGDIFQDRLGILHFNKLDFPTFYGSEDPLNWLNHYEQFFCGQRMFLTDGVWLASYHLQRVAQMWY